MEKTIITVVGRDRVGIIARVCTYLAENSINILDISQTIIGGYLNMMMITDTTAAVKDTDQIRRELTGIGETLGVMILVQHEAIFDRMHRV